MAVENFKDIVILDLLYVTPFPLSGTLYHTLSPSSSEISWCYGLQFSPPVNYRNPCPSILGTFLE